MEFKGFIWVKPTRVITHQNRPTKRAVDWRDSSPFSGIFLASVFFLLSNIFPAHPPTTNANRWALADKLKVEQ
jgi:hypothetical protein